MKIVSIIVPMYNVAHFLERCIASVIAQKLSAGTFEVVMVDDGSPDNSREVADTLSRKHNFIKVVSQQNKGLGGARNTGIANSSGKYLVFLDADDRLLPQSLEQLLDIADQNRVDILEFAAQRESEAGEILSNIENTSNGEVRSGIDYFAALKYMNSACNKIYSRAFLKTYDLSFTEQIYAEDLEFNTRAFYFAKRVMATPVYGAGFLDSANSITRNKSKEKKEKYVRDFIEIMERLSKFAAQHTMPVDKREQAYFDERLTMVNTYMFFFMMKNGFTYKEIQRTKELLIFKGLFSRDFQLADRNRDYFRKYVLNNFWLFRFTQPVLRRLSL